MCDRYEELVNGREVDLAERWKLLKRVAQYVKPYLRPNGQDCELDPIARLDGSRPRSYQCATGRVGKER